MEREPVGGFRIPRVRVTYSLAEPERADWRLWVIRSEWIRLRPEVFTRFDSFAGVGVVQGTVGGDNQTARRGRSLVWLGVGVLGLVLCAVGVPLVGSKGLELGLGWLLRRDSSSGLLGAGVAVASSAPERADVVPVEAVTLNSRGSRVAAEAWVDASVFVVRYVEAAGAWWWVVGSGKGMGSEIEDVGLEVGGVFVGRRTLVDPRGDRVRWCQKVVDAEVGAR
jgi:hypothetical protein